MYIPLFEALLVCFSFLKEIFWDNISLSWLILMFGCYVSDFVGVITHVYAEPFDNLGQEITNAVRIVLIDKRYLKFEMNRFFRCFIYCFDLFIHFLYTVFLYLKRYLWVCFVGRIRWSIQKNDIWILDWVIHFGVAVC
jgi:hypothetical protein